MKGTLQEALDSAREALNEFINNPQEDNGKSTGEGKTIIGTPFDEDTKGNGKDHYKAIATWKELPTTVSTNVGIGKDIKLNDDAGPWPSAIADLAKGYVNTSIITINEDIVEYGREYDPASHVIDVWAGVIEHFDDNDRPTNEFTIVKDCNTCLADNCDSCNLE